ncbi:MarR family winged helix-turn-helix transcriptional regulator [Actinomycetospora chiangmaiensis]|uniref:MarR family winged helix-turn-helix transcriptional regulator n=1 Tax=Actinomycetospora chiangmaiensis TaxID=402650 RepID=UPI0012FCC52E|nr:MarR family transcriptional regulator [Actinomycetospora chiangmaiensis]
MQTLTVHVWDLVVAADRYRQSVSAVAGLSPVEASALEFLLHNGPRPPSLVAARTGLSRTSTTALVDRLADAGWVARQPHPTDRRSVLVALTDGGFDVVLCLYLLFAEDIGNALERADPRLQDDPTLRAAVGGLLGAIAASLRRRAGDRLGVETALRGFRTSPSGPDAAGPP